MSQIRPTRVLVVDDEDRVRNVLCELLTACGYEADGAATPALALELFGRGDYDLVMTDYLMPGADGLELIEGVRRADPTIGVIMLTGAGVDLEGLSQRLDFTLLRKPMQLDGLKAAVREALSRRIDGAPATG